VSPFKPTSNPPPAGSSSDDTHSGVSSSRSAPVAESLQSKKLVKIQAATRRREGAIWCWRSCDHVGRSPLKLLMLVPQLKPAMETNHDGRHKAHNLGENEASPLMDVGRMMSHEAVVEDLEAAGGG